MREALAAAGVAAGQEVGGIAGVGPAAGGMAAPHGSMTAFNSMRESYLAHLALDAAARTLLCGNAGLSNQRRSSLLTQGRATLRCSLTCSKGVSSWRPLSRLRGTTAIMRNSAWRTSSAFSLETQLAWRVPRLLIRRRRTTPPSACMEHFIQRHGHCETYMHADMLNVQFES